MKVNLNVSVRVTLTMTGAAIYNDWNGHFPRNLRERVEPGQTIKLQFWSLMQAFGPSIFMGMGEVPFVSNELELVPDRDYAAEIEYASWRPDGATATVKPGDCVHCGKEICNDLDWCNSFKAAPGVQEVHLG